MKRIISLFMMMIMLTPALACAMTVCAQPASAASVQAQPCEHDGQSGAPSAPALMKDCAGIDLQLTQDSEMPDQTLVLVDAAPAVRSLLSPSVAKITRIAIPHGPPDDRVANLAARHLSTQRLLI